MSFREIKLIEQIEKLQAENMMLREAVEYIQTSHREHKLHMARAFRSTLSVCEQALNSTPETEKIAAVLEAAEKWAYAAQDKPDAEWALPLVEAVMSLKEERGNEKN
jgi:hypothetical protein